MGSDQAVSKLLENLLLDEPQSLASMVDVFARSSAFAAALLEQIETVAVRNRRLGRTVEVDLAGALYPHTKDPPQWAQQKRREAVRTVVAAIAEGRPPSFSILQLNLHIRDLVDFEFVVDADAFLTVKFYGHVDRNEGLLTVTRIDEGEAPDALVADVTRLLTVFQQSKLLTNKDNLDAT